MADNSGTISGNSLAPRRTEGEQGSAEQHPIADQIAAERLRKAQSAAANPLSGVRLTRAIMPGSQGPTG